MFRELNAWLNEDVLAFVIYCGGEGIEAHDVCLRFQNAQAPNEGWVRLGPDRRQKAIWRAINRLEVRNRIERYHSRLRFGHNPSRVRLREVGVLDRIAVALEQSDEH